MKKKKLRIIAIGMALTFSFASVEPYVSIGYPGIARAAAIIENEASKDILENTAENESPADILENTAENELSTDILENTASENISENIEMEQETSEETQITEKEDSDAVQQDISQEFTEAETDIQQKNLFNQNAISLAVENTEQDNIQSENTLILGDAQSDEVQFSDQEDWYNTAQVSFTGDNQSIASKSELCFQMKISEEAWNTMSENDYLKLEADFFQAENNWDTLGKLGWPMYKATDFQRNEDGTYSTEVKMTFESNLNVFHSLLLRCVGTGFKGNILFSNVSLKRAEFVQQDVEITEKVKESIDTASLDGMASEVKLVDQEAIDSAKALAAYLLGLQKSDQVLFGHQNFSFKSVCDNGKTSDSKDVTGVDPALFGIDTLALAGCEVGKATRQEALEASIEASMKAYNSGAIISLSCHMPNFTNSKIKETGDERYPYDFTACDFVESKDLTPCADYILENGKYNPQFRAYLDIIVDYAKALQEKGIPVLFRPFHENSGGWFWWGTSTSIESYQAMWRYMVNYMEDQGVHNFLYVYSPNGPISSEEEYLERYPGDAYVDILAFDYYDDYADEKVYTGNVFFENLAKSCQVIAKLAQDKNKIPAIAETGVRITGAGKDSLMVSGNPTTGHDWYNQVVDTAAANDIPYFLLWANFDQSNFFVPYKTSETRGHEMINEFISFYNNEKSIFGNGTNFYITGDAATENGAVSKAGNITNTGYSTEINGYMIEPKNYAVIKEACELKAYVKNTSEEQVKFVVKASKNAEDISISTKKDGNIYTAILTDEILQKLGATSTGIIILYAENQELGRANFINFNKDIDVLEKGVFENFEYYYGNDALLQSKYGAHNSAANCRSSLALNNTEKVEGDYSGEFHYALSYRGSEVWTGGLGRVIDKDKTDLTEYNAISMWVKPDGNGQKMVIQINDDYEVYLTEFVKGTEAKYVTIPFTSFKKKGNANESVDNSNISNFKFWCNSVPENYTGQKDEEGNYNVEGRILFDDIKAVKISDANLAKVNKEGLIISDEPLTDDKPEIIAVTKITLNKTSLSLTEKEKQSLTATILPENATNKTVVWTSSNKEVATVNQDGLVTAIKKGTAIITATTEDGQKTASCSVNVKAKEEVISTKVKNFVKKYVSSTSGKAYTEATVDNYVQILKGISTWNGLNSKEQAQANKLISSSGKITYKKLYDAAEKIRQGRITSEGGNLASIPMTATGASTSVQLKWSKVKGADGYYIYASRCNKNNAWKCIKTVTSGSTITYTQKSLLKNTAYKYRIGAYAIVNGKKVLIARSLILHTYTTGSSPQYKNPSKVTVSNTKLALKVGKSKKITAKVSSYTKGKKISNHVTQIRYIISNPAIVSITSGGTIKAKKAGSCTIWVCAQNGVNKEIKVTVTK